MHLHMGLQAFPLSKCPGARSPSADQRAVLLRAVMLYQAFPIVECLAARVVLTNEGALVYMCVEVLIQGDTVVERLAARLVLADKRSLVLMSAVVPI